MHSCTYWREKMHFLPFCWQSRCGAFDVRIYAYVHVHVYMLHPNVFWVSFSPNLKSQSRGSVFDETWQKRPRERDQRLRFENEEMTLQTQQAVLSMYTKLCSVAMSVLHTCIYLSICIHMNMCIYSYVYIGAKRRHFFHFAGPWDSYAFNLQIVYTCIQSTDYKHNRLNSQRNRSNVFFGASMYIYVYAYTNNMYVHMMLSICTEFCNVSAIYVHIFMYIYIHIYM